MLPPFWIDWAWLKGKGIQTYYETGDLEGDLKLPDLPAYLPAPDGARQTIPQTSAYLPGSKINPDG